MSTSAATILAHLKTVEDERARRAGVAGLAVKVVALKAYQQRRFSHTYADLLCSKRYGAASHFFLDELYGPTDFSQRDVQFARVVPALVRLFPSAIVETVGSLAALHALSESLDSAMATNLSAQSLELVSGIDYIRAWQETARAADRARQVALTLVVAGRLDQFTRGLLVRNSLRLMRGPAHAAGLSDLQQFLEAGFETFREMKGADDFMAIVNERERTLASSLFTAVAENVDDLATINALANLPHGETNAVIHPNTTN